MIIQEKAEEFLSQLKAKYENCNYGQYQFDRILYVFFDSSNAITRVTYYPHESDASWKYALACFPYKHKWKNGNNNPVTESHLDDIFISQNGELEDYMELKGWRFSIEQNQHFFRRPYLKLLRTDDFLTITARFDESEIEQDVRKYWRLFRAIGNAPHSGVFRSIITEFDNANPECELTINDSSPQAYFDYVGNK